MNNAWPAASRSISPAPTYRPIVNPLHRNARYRPDVVAAKMAQTCLSADRPAALAQRGLRPNINFDSLRAVLFRRQSNLGRPVRRLRGGGLSRFSGRHGSCSPSGLIGLITLGDAGLLPRDNLIFEPRDSPFANPHWARKAPLGNLTKHA